MAATGDPSRPTEIPWLGRNAVVPFGRAGANMTPGTVSTVPSKFATAVAIAGARDCVGRGGGGLGTATEETTTDEPAEDAPLRMAPFTRLNWE